MTYQSLQPSHADKCDVEMLDERAEVNAWLGLVNYQPSSLSWEERVSQGELDKYPPAKKMEYQSSGSCGAEHVALETLSNDNTIVINKADKANVIVIQTMPERDFNKKAQSKNTRR